MANSKSKAAEQAEKALRNLLINMRNDTKAPHTQALANFKTAVREYNKAQRNAVEAVNEALVNTTARKVNGVNHALNTVTRLKGLLTVAAAEATKVPIGENNFTVTKKNGKIVKLEGRGGEYHQFGAQNGKNYVQLENRAWYQLGNTSGQKYNKNKSGKFVKKQGLLGRVGGAVVGGYRGRPQRTLRAAIRPREPKQQDAAPLKSTK